MKTKCIRNISLFLFILFIFNSIVIAEENSTIPMNIRRIYVEKHIFFPAPTWPTHKYFYHRGFEGWLTATGKYLEGQGGFFITYTGYLYNPNYGIPAPAKKIEPKEVTYTLDNDILSSKKYFYYPVNYKQKEKIPNTYYYDDGIYRGVLTSYEMWQNRDWSWTVIYKGYIYSDYYEPVNGYSNQYED